MIFDKPGRHNTAETAALAISTAKERGIKHIVVASNEGDSALAFKGLDGINVVCVTHANGFREKGENEMSGETRVLLETSGIKVLTTTHVLSGAERGISRRAGGMYPVEVMAHTLRMLSAGVKVGVEIAVMALDSGCIPYGEPVIAVGGTGRGADTAIIISPEHANAILETRIHEIICKPA